MCRLEEGDMQRSSVAFEPVAQRRQRAVGVHPFAQVGQHLLAGLCSVQRFEPRPLLRLRLANELKRYFWKDRPRPVETCFVYFHIVMRQQIGFDDGLEGSF